MERVADSSYSMIDPPSVPVSRTALLTIRSRTSSRSRLEPTASPTSRRASSCATLLASSALLDSSARIRSTCRNTIAPSTANSSRSSRSRTSKGATSVRHMDSTPTTSSCRIIGVESRVRKPASRWRSWRPYSASLEHVGNLMGTHVLGCAPDGGRTVPGNRVVQQVLAILLRDLAGDPRETEHVALEEEQLGGLRSAQSRGVFDDGVQYDPGVGERRGRGPRGSRGSPRTGGGRLATPGAAGADADRSSSACPRSLLHGAPKARRVFARIDHSFLRRRPHLSLCLYVWAGAGRTTNLFSRDLNVRRGHTRVLGRMVFAFSTNSMRSHTPVVSCARSR